MSAFGRPRNRAPLSDVTNRSVVYCENSPRQIKGGSTKRAHAGRQMSNAGDVVQSPANVTVKPYKPRMMRLQEQENTEPSELNCRYNTATGKDVADWSGARSWAVQNPKVMEAGMPRFEKNTWTFSTVRKMVQTSLELLMSQSRKVHPPSSLSDFAYGGDLTNVTSSQVHGIAYSSRGTDDDLPPPYPNIIGMRGNGHVSGRGRAIVLASSNVGAPTDMETQIHQLEQEAYCSVLRAFRAQSDAITWEKEDIITDLREELRVSNDTHRELLNWTNNDHIIHSIREWRSTGGLQADLPNHLTIHDAVLSPTTGVRKRQKASPAMHPHQFVAPIQPSSTAARKTVPLDPKTKKMESSQKILGGSAAKSVPSSAGLGGRGPHMNRYFPGGRAAELSQAPNVDLLIGCKVMIWWPDDDNFYEAVISDYNPEMYYTWKIAGSVRKVMGPEDIRWQKDDSRMDPVTYLRSRGAPSSGGRMPTSHAGPMPGPGRGRGFQKNVSKKDFPPPGNGVGKRSSDDIEMLHTESLMKVVENVLSVSNPDRLEVEKAKKAIKDQEQSLTDAIERLAEASDGESG